MNEYEIRPLGHTCAHSGRELKAGETFYSVLVESDGGLVRHDYAEDSFSGPPENAVGFWKSKVPERDDSKNTVVLDVEAIFNFFQQLEGQEDATKKNFRYILALLLLRRKALKFSDVTHEDGVETLVLRRPKGGSQRYRVENPGLSESELTEVQAEVTQILQSPVA